MAEVDQIILRPLQVAGWVGRLRESARVKLSLLRLLDLSTRVGVDIEVTTRGTRAIYQERGGEKDGEADERRLHAHWIA
jgi:hypothetical protein